MAHAFKIMDNTGTIITYTDYDSIPLLSLKHVISFKPDLDHMNGDNHTPDEHREISLWNYKLQLLMIQEREYNASGM